MFIGLCSAPATFERFGLTGDAYLVYLDDIVESSRVVHSISGARVIENPKCQPKIKS